MALLEPLGRVGGHASVDRLRDVWVLLQQFQQVIPCVNRDVEEAGLPVLSRLLRYELLELGVSLRSGGNDVRRQGRLELLGLHNLSLYLRLRQCPLALLALPAPDFAIGIDAKEVDPMLNMAAPAIELSFGYAPVPGEDRTTQTLEVLRVGWRRICQRH